MKNILLLTIIVLLSACASKSNQNQNEIKLGKDYAYQCQSVDEVLVRYLSNDKVQLNYRGETRMLSSVVSASGALYQSELIKNTQWQWWSKGPNALFIVKPQNSVEVKQHCQAK